MFLISTLSNPIRTFDLLDPRSDDPYSGVVKKIREIVRTVVGANVITFALAGFFIYKYSEGVLHLARRFLHLPGTFHTRDVTVFFNVGTASLIGFLLSAPLCGLADISVIKIIMFATSILTKGFTPTILVGLTLHLFVLLSISFIANEVLRGVHNNLLGIGSDIWKVRQDDLKSKPEDMLEELKGDKFKKLENGVKYLGSEGRTERGIDAGGLTRQAISTLITSLVEKAAKKESNRYRVVEHQESWLPSAHPASAATECHYLEVAESKDLTDADIANCQKLVPKTVTVTRDNFTTIQRTIPPMSPGERAGYETLGKIFALCFKKRYPTGPCLSPALFELLQQFSYDQTQTDYLKLDEWLFVNLYKEKNKTNLTVQKMKLFIQTSATTLKLGEHWKPDVVYCLYPDGDIPDDFLTSGAVDMDKVESNFELLQLGLNNRLYLLAKADRTFAPLHAIAKGMGASLGRKRWGELQRTHELSKRIQGVHSKEEILTKTQCSCTTTQKYFAKWISKATPEQCCQLLSFGTGASALGESGLKINVYPARDKTSLPNSHTCSYTIEMPLYDTYELFKEKLEKAIGYGKDGFDFM